MIMTVFAKNYFPGQVMPNTLDMGCAAIKLIEYHTPINIHQAKPPTQCC